MLKKISVLAVSFNLLFTNETKESFILSEGEWRNLLDTIAAE